MSLSLYLTCDIPTDTLNIFVYLFCGMEYRYQIESNFQHVLEYFSANIGIKAFMHSIVVSIPFVYIYISQLHICWDIDLHTSSLFAVCTVENIDLSLSNFQYSIHKIYSTYYFQPFHWLWGTSKLAGNHTLSSHITMVLRKDQRMDARLSAYFCLFRVLFITNSSVLWSRNVGGG